MPDFGSVEHGYYIRGTLKWLMGVLAWLKAWWIRLSMKQVTDPKSMPLLPCWRGNACKSRDFGSVWPQILYPWDFEEVMGVLTWLKAWWIRFGHGCYIRGTLKWLMGVLAWLKAWWIDIRNPCPHCLTGEEMPTKVMILAQFGHGYYIRGTLKSLTDIVAWLKAWWICASVKEVTDQKSMPPLPRRRGNAHKNVVAWLQAWWIRVSVKQVTDPKSISLLPCRRGNARKSRDFGSVWPWILYPWDFEEVMGVLAGLEAWGMSTISKQVAEQKSMPPLHRWRGNAHKNQKSMPRCLGGEEMPTKVMILAQLDHGYYICGTLKRLTDVVAWLKAWWICIRNPCPRCLGGEEMPTKVVILAQFDHGYYIRGTLKRLTDVVAWLKAWWICIRNPCPRYLAGEEMPTKVVILAQFDHGYYIRGTLKRLTDVVAWLKAWWICLSVKQVTDQKSMPCCLGGEEMPTKVMILAQFDHGYYIHGTLKWLMGVLAGFEVWGMSTISTQVAEQKSMPPLHCRRGNAHKSHDFGSV
ncbi:hypothetical protein C8R44DRAFT_724940 [Mycena epipterygia]|nr:hypothetical protein C8R44DRAFT_724940 [Mycena epipterygia]